MVAQATWLHFKRGAISLRREGSCLSETSTTHCSLVVLSPRRDGIHLGERVPLAWASPASLSEAAGRSDVVVEWLTDVWLACMI
ncbi:hypothetical protein DEO72_LG11g2385 [Vigna unguiculata]|uniref:Uncharacterized protein n=1 Tax=Vigna unguiculata TaxID=3917 RepID=A0A4D6NSZ1_VIGUN|nr:hypothetical protein DEO72_LG11g2385 [Vigna unguiculata]